MKMGNYFTTSANVLAAMRGFAAEIQHKASTVVRETKENE
jgi:hypothetical protein